MTLTQTFSCEYCKIFKNNYFEEYLGTTASAFLESVLQKLLWQKLFSDNSLAEGTIDETKIVSWWVKGCWNQSRLTKMFPIIKY